VGPVKEPTATTPALEAPVVLMEDTVTVVAAPPVASLATSTASVLALCTVTVGAATAMLEVWPTVVTWIP